MSAAIVAFGALSALGEGNAAVSAGEPGQPAQVAIRRDSELENAGLARPFAARVSLPGLEREHDRATVLLTSVLSACARDLDKVLPTWRAERVGLAIGTSSGGLRSAERVFSYLAKRRGLARDRLASFDPRAIERGFYSAPLLRAIEPLDLTFARATLVLGACAASSIAIGLAKRWLEDGRCDVVLAGGFDEVSVFVAAGFEALRATTAHPPPRPFREGRDGMALGEGAAVIALISSSRLRETTAPSTIARVHLTGFGASSDAVHLTAPDRTGSGLARAAARALEEAGRPRVDLVSAHGTATPFSDAAEVCALRTVLGADLASRVVVHPFKAQVGHTLGASGVLEALVCADALERGLSPAAAGRGPMDPRTPVRLLTATVREPPETALKLSAAFGGANAALVLSTSPASLSSRGVDAPSADRAVYLSSAVHVALDPDAARLAAQLAQPIERFARADALTRMALDVVARLVARSGPLSGAGVVVGESFATLETDANFHERMEERGVRLAEPRRFPYTSPNAASGECSAVFGLTGPGFAVGCGPCAGIEALAVAADLVRSGDAERVVVVAVDAVGPAVTAMCERLGLDAPSGAVGVVVSRLAAGATYLLRDTRLELGPWGTGPRLSSGHRALLPLIGPLRLPATLEAGGPLLRDGVGTCALRGTAWIESVGLTKCGDRS